MPTAPTAHTPLPAAPSTDDPANFDTEADAFVGALETFGDQMDALATNAYNNAVEANADAIATAADLVQTGLDRTAAAASATAAAASATAAAGSASTAAGWSATSTSSLALTAGSKSITIQTAKQFTAGTNIKIKRTAAPTTSFAFTTVDSYNSGTGALTFTLVSGLITGSGTYTDWTVELSGGVGAAGQGVPTGGTTGQVLKKSSGTDYDAAWTDADSVQVLRSARTADTQLVAADKGKLIEITGAGGFSQTFAAAATLGSGWFAYILNSSTGDVTLDANGTETIGGVNAAATAVLKPGQGTIVTSDGSNLYFATQPTGFRNMEIFKTSGTFTPKPGVSRYYIRAIGGGGAGYRVGGAAGGYAEGFATITSAQTVTIGAGSTSTSAGGQTSVGSIVVCNGGQSGSTSTTGPSSQGGTATFSGGLTFQGAGASAYGNAGNVGTPGASTPFGGGGAAGSQSSSSFQNAADNTGAGGGGDYSGGPGYGGSGLVIFMW